MKLDIEKLENETEVIREDCRIIALANSVGIAYIRGYLPKNLVNYATKNNKRLIDFDWYEFSILCCQALG